MIAALIYILCTLIGPITISWKFADPLIMAYCKGFARRHKDRFDPGLERLSFVIAVIIFQTVCQVAFFLQMSRSARNVLISLGVVMP